MKRVAESEEFPDAKKRLAPEGVTYEAANEAERLRCVQINALLSVMQDQYDALAGSQVCTGFSIRNKKGIYAVEFVVEEVAFREDLHLRWFGRRGRQFVLPGCTILCANWSDVSKTAATLEPTTRLLFLDLILEKAELHATKIGQFYEAVNDTTAAISNALGANWGEVARGGPYKWTSRELHDFMPTCKIVAQTAKQKLYINMAPFLVGMLNAVFAKYSFPVHWKK